MTQDRIYIAILSCLAAHFMFAVMGACAKYLADSYHVIEIAFYRNIFVFVPMLLFILSTNKTHLFKTNKPRLVWFRALVGSISLIVTFGALSKLPMAYATVLFYMSTILTPALAHFFLKEHVGIHRWSAVFFGMCGVIIIAQPSGSISMIGLILALCAATLHSIMYTTLRSLKTESPITVTFYFMLAGIIIPAIALPWFAKGPSMDDLWAFGLVGAAGGIAQIFLSTAYKFGPASLITPFSYTSLLWTVLLDLYLWQYDLEFTYLALGAGLIICAQLYIIYREHINKRTGGT